MMTSIFLKNYLASAKPDITEVNVGFFSTFKSSKKRSNHSSLLSHHLTFFSSKQTMHLE